MESIILQQQDNRSAELINDNDISDYLKDIAVVKDKQVISTSKPFIEANTSEVSFEEMMEKHIIPVFIKDNEPVISHTQFIEAMVYEVNKIYNGEMILKPNIRVSHPIKGRIPEARNKPAHELLKQEKTLYYERMAFVIEIPSVYDDIDGNSLSLCVGGVKSYSLDNLYARQGADQHFKIFIGFKNSVCTNLCVWTDGFVGDLKVSNIGQLRACIYSLISKYNLVYHLNEMRLLKDYSITEKQFATIVGKCRMYQYLPHKTKTAIPALYLGDSQLNCVCKDYYKDNSFCKNDDGSINLWKLYNLFTNANKSSYIDNFIDRNVNAYNFAEAIRFALQNKSSNWFLN
ncbi:MAG TPA: DUF3871 family protein [Parafilimonas sp.]|nr:DUF3871 family protein [Parafilimonas sp.]